MVAVLAAFLICLCIMPKTFAAGETIDFAPASGAPGDSVTVTGSGWSAGGGVVMVFVDPAESVDPTKALVAVTPAADGTLSTSLTVPPRDASSYRFFACQICVDNPDGFPNASQSFTIEPAAATEPDLTLQPQSGSPGDPVTASGTGWSLRLGAVSVFASPSDISDPSKVIGTGQPDANGTFSAPATVPTLPDGTYEFYACQRCGDADGFPSASEAFTVVPAQVARPLLVVTPASARSGRSVTASGSGWRADGGSVSVFAAQPDSSDPSLALASASAAADGTFTVPLAVPARPTGTYDFFACQPCDGGDGALSAEVTFTILARAVISPELTLSPSAESSGQTVTATGSNWPARRGAVSVFANAAESGDPANALAVADVNVDGTFATAFEVPDRDTGDYEFFACQACGDPQGFPLASASFTIEGKSGFPLLIVLVAAAALVLGGLAAARHMTRRRVVPRQAEFVPHDDLSLDVTALPSDGPPLPSLRLVPHDDESTIADQVEVSQ